LPNQVHAVKAGAESAIHDDMTNRAGLKTFQKIWGDAKAETSTSSSARKFSIKKTLVVFPNRKVDGTQVPDQVASKAHLLASLLAQAAELGLRAWASWLKTCILCFACEGYKRRI